VPSRRMQHAHSSALHTQKRLKSRRSWGLCRAGRHPLLDGVDMTALSIVWTMRHNAALIISESHNQAASPEAAGIVLDTAVRKEAQQAVPVIEPVIASAITLRYDSAPDPA
jgi:hypothetical protein